MMVHLRSPMLLLTVLVVVLSTCTAQLNSTFTPAVVKIDLALREKLKSANVMLCAILKNEQLYIDEWLQYHKYLGFDRAHLYDNADNASSYLASLPEIYKDFVQVTHFPGLGRQRDAYLNCTREHGNNNTWGAFLDIDEFVVLRKHANIKSFLHEVAPDGGSVVLGWNVFGSNGLLTREPGPVVARFTMTSQESDKHVKSMAYLDHALEPNIHNCPMKPGHPTVDQHGRPADPDSPYVFGNDRQVAHINHYYTKSWEEFKAKRSRGWASSYKLNYLMTGRVQDVHNRMAHDFKVHNKVANEVEDTFARDFYLRNHLGRAYHAIYKD